MIVGMDFGTTNSGMAVYDGRSVRVLSLDPNNANPRVLRTSLYIRNDQNVAIGRAALNQYFEQNVGRAVKMQRVWVGELDIRGADMHFVTDAYVWVDALSPGRLFLSFKTSLRDSDYLGTVIGQFFYPLEDIIAIYLNVARQRAEKLLGRELRQAVLGRPVRFATDPQKDRLAQERLLQAAFRAGYEKVYLQYEPVAAAYNYAANVAGHAPQNILVFDFGGGTLDVTIMRINGRRREVLATGGIPVAGDVFDQKLLRAKLPPHFGEDSHYGPPHKEMPVPRWLYDIFSNWQRILELQTSENRRVLQEIAQTARRPRQIEALISLVSGNYGLKMFDAVEQAKRELSERIGTMIRFQGPAFDVMEMVTRSQFETIIRIEILAINQHLDDMVAASGLQPDEIDAVIRTGGSAQIPVFQEMLREKFGRDKLVSIDTFSSVTAGLGIIAHEIDAGQMEVRGYTPADLTMTTTAATEKNVAFVNLDLIQRRIAVQEKAATKEDATAERALIILTADNQLHPVVLPAGTLEQPGAIQHEPALRETLAQRGAKALTVAGLDDPLLLVTSHYRFLLVTSRELTELPSLGLTLENLFTLKGAEHICSLAHWNEVKQQPKLLLATSRGYARAYQLEALVALIEGPVPHQLDQPLAGRPIAVLGAAEHDSLVIVTGSGRAGRIPLATMPLTGIQAINYRNGSQDDWAVAAVCVPEENEILVTTATGHGRRLSAGSIYAATGPNQKGKVIVSRRPVIGLAPVHPIAPLWLLTSTRLVAVEPDRLPRDDRSTQSHPMLKLAPEEQLLSVSVHLPGDMERR